MPSPDFSRQNDPRAAEHPQVPHRREEDRVAAEIAATLRRRGARASEDENPDRLATLLSTVERFEAARARLGGDSFTNTAASSHPDDESFVLPVRSDDEAIDAYIERIRRAAERLEARL